MQEKNKILTEVGNYYSEKIRQHGTSPKGVDWNSTDSQELRFDVLSNVLQGNQDIQILDYGCGYGAMFEYYNKRFHNLKFTGFDISEEMISAAESKFSLAKNANWLTKLPAHFEIDYIIASGIFNVKLENTNENWLDYIITTLQEFNKLSIKGFSFNMLTKYSDKEYMKEYLYYADPLYIFDYCKRNFSRNVALLHDYELYEFTIIVRK